MRFGFLVGALKRMTGGATLLMVMGASGALKPPPSRQTTVKMPSILITAGARPSVLLCLRPPPTHANRPPFRFTAGRDRSRGDSGLAGLLEGRLSGIYRLGGVHGEPAAARGQFQLLQIKTP